MEEASLDLGANFLTTFSKIVLPLMFPAFIAGFIYTFMTAIVSLSAVVFLVSPGFRARSRENFRQCGIRRDWCGISHDHETGCDCGDLYGDSWLFD